MQLVKDNTDRIVWLLVGLGNTNGHKKILDVRNFALLRKGDVDIILLKGTQNFDIQLIKVWEIILDGRGILLGIAF